MEKLAERGGNPTPHPPLRTISVTQVSETFSKNVLQCRTCLEKVVEGCRIYTNVYTIGTIGRYLNNTENPFKDAQEIIHCIVLGDFLNIRLTSDFSGLAE